MCSDATELVNQRKSAENDPVPDMNMSGQLCTVGENRVVADLAIMRQMDVSHDPVVVTQTGDSFVLNRSQVEGTEFANGVAIADFQFRLFPCIFFVLRHTAQRCELENAIVFADSGMSFNNDMRTNPRTCPDFDIGTDNGIGPDFYGTVQFRPRINDCSRMNSHQDSAF